MSSKFLYFRYVVGSEICDKYKRSNQDPIIRFLFNIVWQMKKIYAYQDIES